MSAQAAEKVKAQVQKVKDKAQIIVDGIAVSIFVLCIAICLSFHLSWLTTRKLTAQHSSGGSI